MYTEGNKDLRDVFPEMKATKSGVKHPTGKICKYCKVDVYIKDGKVYPVLGKQHKPGCPRARDCN